MEWLVVVVVLTVIAGPGLSLVQTILDWRRRGR